MVTLLGIVAMGGAFFFGCALNPDGIGNLGTPALVTVGAVSLLFLMKERA
jgi:hypothetical protein